MLTDQDKAQCVLWLAETKSLASVRRRFRQKFKKEPPSISDIRVWSERFKETGSISNITSIDKNVPKLEEQPTSKLN